VVGAFLAGTTVLFQRDGQRSKGPVAFRSEGGRFLAADLAPGEWKVRRDGATVKSGVKVSAEQGTLWFEGPAGSYELVFQNGAPARQ
jgi:hypothetical protein